MKKISKKAIFALSTIATISGICGTLSANYILHQNSIAKNGNKNVLNRDKTYHHYSITNKLNSNIDLNKIVTINHAGSSVFYIINEENFVHNICDVIRSVLKSISIFSNNYQCYRINCSYKIEGTSRINVDVVWYLDGSVAKYYDQFVIELSTY